MFWGGVICSQGEAVSCQKTYFKSLAQGGGAFFEPFANCGRHLFCLYVFVCVLVFVWPLDVWFDIVGNVLHLSADLSTCRHLGIHVLPCKAAVRPIVPILTDSQIMPLLPMLPILSHSQNAKGMIIAVCKRTAAQETERGIELASGR